MPDLAPDTRQMRVLAPGGPADRLGVLAAAAAAVSFTAQYRMVDATRHLPVIAALEAAIPDAAALVFASLGIALALHGRRALRARALNLAAVGTSVLMNVLAAEPGWRNLAIWALPPIAYALASDTLISVGRAHYRHGRPAEGERSWLYDAVEDGAIEAIRLGKQLRFRPSALIRYLEEHASKVNGH